jgi:hypothetical protein
MPSDPGVENDGPSDELSVVIGLVIFLLAAPSFLAIVLLLIAQPAFRDFFAGLRNAKLFCRISNMQSISLDSRGSSEALNTAAGSLRSGDCALSPDKIQKAAPPVNLNQIDEGSIIFSDGSQLSARRITLPHPSKSEISQ